MGNDVSKHEVETAKQFYSLSETEVQNWLRVFKKNTSFVNRGCMTKQNFEEAFGELHNGKRIASTAFQLFDWDGNGTISFNEFMFAMLVNSSVTPKQKLCYAFDLLDLDGNGEITLSEMRTLVRNLEGSKSQINGHVDRVSEADIKETFNKMDENGDGSLTKTEFVNQARNHAGWLLNLMDLNI